MGCEDSAHGGLRNAVPGSRWEIGAQRRGANVVASGPAPLGFAMRLVCRLTRV
ncbi:hypothetical protein C7S16_0125 [Burkholderia thailandensis]|uniref:200 kDa antigen p200 n=1 Tax=Burkholderia thailandensis TaxID=57975 RepID=A0AAW9CZS3_BURTH|nr:hypothetical protein [Burkholderia thailandensis]MDW9255166.1 hypothetical protein [Burkholderia thailandensis]